ARTKGGRKNVLAAYGRFNTIHPESPMGVWYTALETMYVALDSQLQDGKDSSADYEQAEAMFQLCRQLEPGYEANCISYELICRNGIGWCRYNNGDLAGSKEAFLSMEALKTGGLEWALGTQLFSGVMGLQFIAGKHAEDGQKADSLRKASEIFDYLHAYRPEDADFANNTGFFNRDTAVLLDIQAQMNFERAKTAATANEAKDMSLRGEELRSEAQTLMERSYAAYQEASRLGPDDVRVVNDTGLIMTYYLCNDVEAAERYLYSATEMGEVQVAEMRAAVEELRMQVALEKDDLAAAAAKADIDVIRLAKVRAAEAQLAEARRAARDLLTIEEQKLIPAPQPDAALEVSTEAVNATDAVTEVGPTDLEVQLTELEDKLDNLMEAWGDAYQNLGILYLTVTRQPDRALPFLEKSVEIGPLPRVPRGFIRESLIPICKEAMSGKLEAIRQVRGVWHHNAPKAKQ
ncbi:MAG: tetratricopeptide (TPR) repeat protein, partial [Planctomycetota bacterium]